MNKAKPSFSEKEEKMLKSYNEQFYSSLKSIKLINHNLTPEEKLFYRFEQNENASVSSTIGQLMSTYDELYAKNELLKKKIKELSAEIAELIVKCDQVNGDVKEQFKPQIEILDKALSEFKEEQKIENYKLKEEISLLEKEKAEIQQDIYDSLGYLNKLEKQVGVKAKTVTYIYDQTISENETGSKFIIQKEDI